MEPYPFLPASLIPGPHIRSSLFLGTNAIFLPKIHMYTISPNTCIPSIQSIQSTDCLLRDLGDREAGRRRRGSGGIEPELNTYSRIEGGVELESNWSRNAVNLRINVRTSNSPAIENPPTGGDVNSPILVVNS